VDFMFDVTAAVPHVKAGKLKALAVTSSARASVLPEVLTLAEAGLPGVEIFSWYAYLAPAGTPPAILAQLNRDIAEVLGGASVQGRLVGYGLEPADPMKPDEVDRFIRKEVDRWAKVVKDAGVKPQ
jgi:tripartite-type tricarboxylate transporter receptor subunit TctC